jgi:hypothetical protein
VSPSPETEAALRDFAAEMLALHSAEKPNKLLSTYLQSLFELCTAWLQVGNCFVRTLIVYARLGYCLRKLS